MAELASINATIQGRVQGVGFRYFTSRYAKTLSLAGYVQNLPNGDVEVEAEGEREELKKLAEYLETGTSGARVDRIDITWSDYTGNYSGFSIRS